MLNKIFDFLFKKYPAYFWENPNIYKIILFPIIFYHYLKKKDDR
jgi:hypothetical protein